MAISFENITPAPENDYLAQLAALQKEYDEKMKATKKAEENAKFAEKAASSAEMLFVVYAAHKNAGFNDQQAWALCMLHALNDLSASKSMTVPEKLQTLNYMYDFTTNQSCRSQTTATCNASSI